MRRYKILISKGFLYMTVEIKDFKNKKEALRYAKEKYPNRAIKIEKEE